MSFDRTDRVSEELKKELAALIPNLKDPRISGMCSVVSATITKDFKFAKAYISVLGNENISIAALNPLGTNVIYNFNYNNFLPFRM